MENKAHQVFTVRGTARAYIYAEVNSTHCAVRVAVRLRSLIEARTCEPVRKHFAPLIPAGTRIVRKCVNSSTIVPPSRAVMQIILSASVKSR